MTAADALSFQPAPRPEPETARRAASERTGERTSFADVLNIETAETTDTADSSLAAQEPDAGGSRAREAGGREAGANERTDSDETSTDASLALVPPQAVMLATASPAVILAGFTPQEAGAGTRKGAPVGSAASETASQAAGLAAAPLATNGSVVHPQTGTDGLDAALAGATASASGGDATADAAGEAAPSDSTDGAPAPQAALSAANTLPAGAAQAAIAPLAAELAKPPQAGSSLPSSAPGVERAAAPLEPSSGAAAKADSPRAGAAGADASQQTPGAKPGQAASPAPDVAREIKAEATASASTSASPTDGLTAQRGPAADAGKPAPTAPAAQAAPAATVQVYTRMIERFDGRAQRFEIRLDPAELGRVDVRIEVGADKKVHAVLAAHDSAALSDLMRGQRSLEASLRQAGIDVADGGIKFELSSDAGRNSSNGASREDTSPGQGATNVWRGFSVMDVPVDAPAAAAAQPWRASRLDLVA